MMEQTPQGAPHCGVSVELRRMAVKMNSLDYQHLAHEAENRAWAETSDHLRGCWLDLAQAWLALAQLSGPPATQDVSRGRTLPANAR